MTNLSEYPQPRDIYHDRAKRNFVIDKVTPDGWIFVRNTTTQAKHRMQIDRFKKDYTYVSHS